MKFNQLLRGPGVVFFIILAFLASLQMGFGQETTGTIEGTVTDQSGGGIPGAVVEISGTTLVRAQTTPTNASGYYSFQTLPPGAYRLTLVAKGFATMKQEGINLLVGRTVRIDMKPQVGSVNETVAVTAEALQIDTTTTTIAQDVTKDFFDRIPKGRNYDSLIALAPGARVENKSGQYQIDGSSGSENAFYIDGADQTDIQNGSNPVQARIPFEFLNQFQIKSSGFEAQYGGATGGVVQAVTRSGSNDFHGDFALYLGTDSLNGGPHPTLQLNPTNDNLPFYVANKKDGDLFLNPGGDIGGKIIRDKLWFFVGWFPQFHYLDRTVTFLRDSSTRQFDRVDRQDYLISKLDYAPFSKLRLSTTYLYTPQKQNGVLPGYSGTSNPTTDYKHQGFRRPASSYIGSLDYSVSSKLLLSFRGSHNYENYKDYGIPRGLYLNYLAPSTGLAGVPAQYQAASGQFTPSNSQYTIDENTRVNLSFDASYSTSLFGQQHTFKAGWSTNRLHNTVFNGYPDGYFRIGWNRAIAGVTVPGKAQGTYGYIVDRSTLSTTGDVGSNNTGFYFQDQWRATKRLTLSLGLRLEHEFVPSFSSGKNADGLAFNSQPIEFGWGSKIAPRLGFAMDVLGNGKLKWSGSFSRFYDTMKYNLPRGSFGGDVWKDYVYPLNGSDLSQLKPGVAPFGAPLFEVVDYRIPSNDPSDNLIDPNLKPFSVHAWDTEVDYQLTGNTVVSGRYTRRRVDHAIEDVGLLLAAGETYFIANPGYGVSIDPKNFGGGIPVTPKAERNYDAIEIRADRRFSRNLTYSLSYTYSRLYGNYSGLANSDESSNGAAGRLAPNSDRSFDLPFINYDSHDKPIFGPLATDRPHTFKAFVAYTHKSRLGETTIAPVQQWYSGTPLTTEVQIFSIATYPNNRGDLGRTPVFRQTDLLVGHDIPLSKIREGFKVHLEANFTNLLNQDTVLDRYVTYSHPNDGGLQLPAQADYFKGFDYKSLLTAQKIRVDPRFGLPALWQTPRSIRFGMKFTF